MKRKFYSIALVAVVISLTGCGNDDDSQADLAKFITVSPEIGMMTRVSTDDNGVQSFDNGDVISVYAWTSNNGETPTKAPQKGDRFVDNSHNTFNDGKWDSSPQMLWKNMQDKHYFIGVYPAIEQGKGADDDLTRYSYTLKPENQIASDLLVAVESKGIVATKNSIPLKFTHLMAKIEIILSYRNQWGIDEMGNNLVPTVTSVKLVDAADQAMIDLFTKAVSPSDKRNNMLIPVVRENTQYSSIVIPQSGVRQIIIEIDGKNYTYTQAESDFFFESGKVTTFSLTVGRDKITLDGVTIAPWENAGNPIYGETEE